MMYSGRSFFFIEMLSGCIMFLRTWCVDWLVDIVRTCVASVNLRTPVQVLRRMRDKVVTAPRFVAWSVSMNGMQLRRAL